MVGVDVGGTEQVGFGETKVLAYEDL